MKEYITNKDGKKLAVVVENTDAQNGLAFIMHGLGGFKDQPHVVAMAEVFKNKGYTVVRFDVANTIGESEGDLFDATATNYYSDLEDVIAWAKKQEWYSDPFYLVGHSLGGLCIGMYAQNHPEEVCGLAPISSVVSGTLLSETEEFESYCDEWQRDGIREWESSSSPGVIKRLPWSHVEDRLQYDLLPGIEKLTMPVLLIVGSEDTTTPLQHQQLFYEKLSEKKFLHIIESAPHTFKEDEHVEELQRVIADWIDSI